MNGIIFSSQDEMVAIRYFSSLNNTVGAVAFAVAISLLQFKHPEMLAYGAVFVFSIWAFNQGVEYRRMLRFIRPDARPSTWVFIQHGWLYIISLVLLSLIAGGQLTNAMFN